MNVLEVLRVEETRLKTDLGKVQKAIAALNGAGSHSPTHPVSKPGRKLSAAGRARIVAALKARWAKAKQAQKKGK